MLQVWGNKKMGKLTKDISKNLNINFGGFLILQVFLFILHYGLKLTMPLWVVWFPIIFAISIFLLFIIFIIIFVLIEVWLEK